MKPAALWRIGLVLGLVALLEALCLAGVIDKLTMQPPHAMVLDIWRMLASGSLNAAIAKTLGNAAIAFLLAMVIGVATAIVIHRAKAVREALDPLFATYYAIPIFAFYPLLIILFGLGDAPEIFIGTALGVVGVIVSTLNGLDRVPRVLMKTARIARFGTLETAWRITLPYASPYILSGAKLAVAYSLIGIIGAEFIMSSSGMGYEISFAYNNFDNATMYPLIVLVLVVAGALNAALGRWEKALMARRGLA
ncbi:ABC transporter permease [Inquilinus limosus]|uniref:Nitrate ABC transporter permease n=1 Tax=Inquilinus limosus MP06 TaxID=1398085 RepID=A0A0A0DFW7_9PROT|nr:ABC transporter permease subunit [Inquilinus limosus]KGM35837.1 nitrate ABC transporter permease [Inquilinus limosus MP06]